MPALLNTRFTWSVPCCATTSSRNRITWLSSDTSQTWVVMRVPAGDPFLPRPEGGAAPGFDLGALGQVETRAPELSEERVVAVHPRASRLVITRAGVYRARSAGSACVDREQPPTPFVEADAGARADVD